MKTPPSSPPTSCRLEGVSNKGMWHELPRRPPPPEAPVPAEESREAPSTAPEAPRFGRTTGWCTGGQHGACSGKRCDCRCHDHEHLKRYAKEFNDAVPPKIIP